MLVDGKIVAAELDRQLQDDIARLGIQPKLAIVQIGTNPESDSYIGAKKRSAQKLGIRVKHIRIKDKISTQKLIDRIQTLGEDKTIDGVIVQLPIPKKLDTRKIIAAVPFTKDVDGFCANSQFIPPVAAAVLELLKVIGEDKNISDKNVVVLGRGITGGDTVIRTFNKLHISHSVIHSQTEHPDKILREADIVISAVGKPGVIKSNQLKKGVILINIGMTKTEAGFVGDYDEDDIKKMASYYTSTPGGIGPLTVHFLMMNVYEAVKS